MEFAAFNEFHVAKLLPRVPTMEGEWARKVSGGTWERGSWVSGSPGDWERTPEWRDLIWAEVVFLLPPSKGNEYKESSFSTSPFCFKVQIAMSLGFGFGLWIWIFLNVHSLCMAGYDLFYFAFSSCCQCDDAKYYAGQVKCVTLWEFA